MSSSEKSCCAPLRVKLVFACSGASDVGGIADQAARRVAGSKAACMSCVAGLGAEIPDILEIARVSPRIVAIDGCDRECVRLCLEKAGLKGFSHVKLHEMGMEKRKTPPTEERIQRVADKAIELLKAPAAGEAAETGAAAS